MPRDIATNWLASFSSALDSLNPQSVADLFLADGWFRDVLTFTWDLRALEGRPKITAYLTESSNLERAKIKDIKMDERTHYKPVSLPIAKPDGAVDNGIEFCFTYETWVGPGRGCARLLKDQSQTGEWRAISVGMILYEIRGHEESSFESGIYGGHTLAWSDVKAERRAQVEKDPHVLIVGAGQTGLQIAARFKQMNIPTLVIDRNERIGDTWRRRYPTLVLHTFKEHHQFLYQPYPANWPYYTPRDKLADWMEFYANTQDLVVWMNSQMSSQPIYDAKAGKWSVTISTGDCSVEIHPAHIVLATGTLGSPRLPTLPNQIQFQGEILHGSQYAGGEPFKDKRVVVVGAGNTGIDVCQDLHHHNARSVTMVQRSSTCVVTGDNTSKHMEETWTLGNPVEVGDFKFASYPLGLQKKVMQGMQALLWDEEKELHEKLRKGGIKLNMGPEGQGQFLLVFERAGGKCDLRVLRFAIDRVWVLRIGYWLDKGGADLIASGDVKVKQGVQPTGFSNTSLLFEDHTELQADAVIFATGYNNIRDDTRKIFGADVIDRTSEVWGLDNEGEVRGSFRPCGHPGLWYAAGDFYNSRFMSKHLAIQIKAIELGLMNHPDKDAVEGGDTRSRL